MLAKFISRTLLVGSLLCAAAMPAMAQSQETAIPATQISSQIIDRPAFQVANTAPVDPDLCINAMADFPADDQEARYQFFRLTQEMARGATPEFRNALRQYGEGDVSPHSPMLTVIEEIANPVLRQAAPELTVGNMAYVIDFYQTCEPFVIGQIESLKAYDGSYSNAEFNAVIVEDALFLRQILSDSMYRLSADKDGVHSFAVGQYAQSLITARDEMEFSTFESELDELEAVYMTDLDGRLKRSNDLINEEMDRETLGDAVALSDSLNAAEKRKAKERHLYTLFRILGGRG